MLQKFLNFLLPHRIIVNCNREPYLHRWYLVRTKYLGIFIHQFIRSDEDRALHDHPWNFLVIPIFKGYNEFNLKGCTRVWPILGTRFRPATYQHRVELIRDINNKEIPAWSIFFRFKEFRDWGFWPGSGFVNWNRWWQDKCE